MKSFRPIFYALLGIALLFLLVRGTFVALAFVLPLLLKFGLPVIGAYYGYRFLRNKMKERDLVHGNSQTTIDLCPSCGAPLTAKHRCK